MARLLVAEVTLIRNGDISLGIRLRGGAIRKLNLEPELPAWKLRRAPAPIVAEIDALLDQYNEAQIASISNARGFRSGTGEPFRPRLVAAIRRRYNLRNRFQRLRDRGFLTRREIAARLHIVPTTVSTWRLAGLLHPSPTPAMPNTSTRVPANFPPPSTRAVSSPNDARHPTSRPTVPQRRSLMPDPSSAPDAGSAAKTA